MKFLVFSSSSLFSFVHGITSTACKTQKDKYSVPAITVWQFLCYLLWTLTWTSQTHARTHFVNTNPFLTFYENRNTHRDKIDNSRLWLVQTQCWQKRINCRYVMVMRNTCWCFKPSWNIAKYSLTQQSISICPVDFRDEMCWLELKLLDTRSSLIMDGSRAATS